MSNHPPKINWCGSTSKPVEALHRLESYVFWCCADQSATPPQPADMADIVMDAYSRVLSAARNSGGIRPSSYKRLCRKCAVGALLDWQRDRCRHSQLDEETKAAIVQTARAETADDIDDQFPKWAWNRLHHRPALIRAAIAIAFCTTRMDAAAMLQINESTLSMRIAAMRDEINSQLGY